MATEWQRGTNAARDLEEEKSMIVGMRATLLKFVVRVQEDSMAGEENNNSSVESAATRLYPSPRRRGVSIENLGKKRTWTMC